MQQQQEPGRQPNIHPSKENQYLTLLSKYGSRFPKLSGTWKRNSRKGLKKKRICFACLMLTSPPASSKTDHSAAIMWKINREVEDKGGEGEKKRESRRSEANIYLRKPRKGLYLEENRIKVKKVSG